MARLHLGGRILRNIGI